MQHSYLPSTLSCLGKYLHKTTAGLAAGVLATGLLMGTAQAASVPFVPSDLNPGDTYHVVFITDGVKNGLDSNIADYNTFVQGEAELTGATTETWGVDWFAIASTVGTDANANIPVSGSPIYLLTDARVADDATDLWDGTIQTAISINQFGLSESNQDVWTGTADDGGAALAQAMGTGSPATGLSGSTNSDWVDAGNAIGVSNNFALYAVSEELTVAPVPVPAAAWLFGSGLIGLFGTARRKVT